jgi:hypothetical protein
MPFYTEIVVISEVNHNGKKYIKGETVRTKVCLTEMEARFLNAQVANVDDPQCASIGMTGCKYVLEGETPKTNDPGKPKTYAKMNKAEREEYAKQKAAAKGASENNEKS